jgi:integrase
MRLTTKRIARLSRQPGRYHDGHGLHLQVINPNNISWQLRYERNGRERWLGLSPLHVVGLKLARERAQEARLSLLNGIDPIDERRAAKTAAKLAAARTMSFQEAALAYFDSHEKRWRNRRHRDQFLSSMQAYAFPIIGALPVSAIDTGLVLKTLEQKHNGQRLWDSVPETASRLRSRIEATLDWAAVRGLRPPTDNPARWKGHLKEALPPKIAKTVNFPSMPYAQVPQFMTRLRAEHSVAARALEFAILTAGRTGEVLGARWSEIDLGGKVWVVPATRMKGGKEHRVPLCPAAIALLKSLYTQANDDTLFIGGARGGLGAVAMLRLLRKLASGVTVHGFRSSFRVWAAECTAFPEIAAELSLAHAPGSAVEKAYRRTTLFDQRRRLMQAWAQHCYTPVKDQARVIALRGAPPVGVTNK